MTTIANTNLIQIREVTVNDAAQTLALQRAVIAENRYLLLQDHEFNRTTEQQINLIKQTLVNAREKFLVADREKDIIGLIYFQSPSKTKVNHTGTLGLVVKSEHRGVGIGKRLLKALLDWATLNPLIEKVCLSVFSNNYEAIKLYKGFGFIEEGRRVKAFKLSDQQYIDEILMYKFVDSNTNQI